MEKRYIFDYYYGAEAEQFSFFRVPKILFKEKKFKNISTDAKVLYGMMIDRMSLSRQNKWIDEQNRVYIIYTLSDIMEDLDCGKDKGVHLIAELDERGIGLIERRKQGFGKPALIYVKNFISCIEQDDCEDIHSVPEEMEENVEENIYGFDEDETPKSLENSGFCQTSEKPKSLGAECRSRDFGKTEVMTSEKPKSRGRKNRSFEVGKTEVNDTNINNIDISDTNINNTYINPLLQDKGLFEQEDGEMEEQLPEEKVYENIKHGIDFDYCMQEIKTDPGQKCVKFLLDLICDVIAHPRETIRIGGIDVQYHSVREKFMKLTSAHVLYVVKTMQESSSRVKNPSAYALTALYNADRYIELFRENRLRQVSEKFDEFWNNFPLKIRKIETEEEYINLISEAVPEEELVQAAKNYAEEISLLEKDKVCYPSNFLARGIYKDYVPGKYISPKGTKKQLARGQERSYSEEELKELEEALLSTPVTH